MPNGLPAALQPVARVVNPARFIGTLIFGTTRPQRDQAEAIAGATKRGGGVTTGPISGALVQNPHAVHRADLRLLVRG